MKLDSMFADLRLHFLQSYSICRVLLVSHRWMASIKFKYFLGVEKQTCANVYIYDEEKREVEIFSNMITEAKVF